MKKTLFIAVTLLAFAVPLVVSARPVYKITDTMQLKLPITAAMAKLQRLQDLSLAFFQSVDNEDNVVFTWINDQGDPVIANLKDKKNAGWQARILQFTQQLPTHSS